MARISNTSAYPNLVNPVSSDYLILTDQSDQLLTKSCTLGDVQSLFGLDTLVAKVAVNSAALLALNTTAATLVAAPGTGKVIDVISIMFYLDAGAVAYDFGVGSLPIKIGSEEIASIPNSASTINSAADAVFKPEVPNTNEIIAQNTALTLEAQANPTQGTGVLYANVFYRVLTVGSSF
tara:strand:- start:1651 stop:2187 length:537 start_codon:yes stop_codon:yes gene_type:complete